MSTPPENNNNTPPVENPPAQPPTEPINAVIINKDIKLEMTKSYIDYAMSVIVGRAIPDVRDGLKPVHRRILFSMSENGFFHNTPTRKCARIVGDVLGRYHPHGDMAVYDSLVRMAQPFSLRYMLVEGQGNFGSVDGDSAAAMRYTEARLAKISNEMLEDLDKNTVDFTDNFDGSMKEPVFLPAKLPNLLLNGVTGIAVGMATNMAPHNLKEVCNAICAAIDVGPEQFTPDDVFKHIKGPDFPTAGMIMGKQGINDAIRTGKGSIVLRARAEIETAEESGRNKDAIIVTEIPYTVNKTTLIEAIAELVNKQIIPEISDVRDESDRTGMRIFIELKKNSDVKAVLNRLYMKTQLQNRFSITNLVLVNNGKQPKILNYAELIKEFVYHRLQVVKRRMEFELAKAEKRLHILEGLIIAIDHIDEIIAIIKKSANTEEAAKNLMAKYPLDEIQCDEILKMPLSRLTNLQTQKLVDEKQDLIIKIVEIKAILADKAKIYAIIRAETQKIGENFGDERRTEIQEAASDLSVNIAETIPEEDCVFVLTKNQMIKRMTLENYQAQRRGGKGKKGMEIREEDLIQDMFIASSRSTILLFTQEGRVYSIPAYKIPLGSRTSKGKAIINYINAKTEEKIIDLMPVDNFTDQKSLIFVTQSGTAKKTNLDEFSNIRSNGINCMNVREGDKLLGVKLCNPGDHIFIPTKDGQAIHFDETELRPIGRTAMGVRGITLEEGDEVVDLVVSTPDTKILSITEHGYGKLSALDLYRTTHRGGKGVINIKLRDEGDKLIAAKAIKTNENLLLASSKGHLIRIRSEDVRETGRAAKGVIVMKLDEDDSITSVALCDAAEEVGEIILSKEKTTVVEEPEEEQPSEIKVGKNEETTPAEPEEEVDEEDFRVKHHEDDDSDDE